MDTQKTENTIKVQFVEGGKTSEDTISIVAWQQGQKLQRVTEFLKNDFKLEMVSVDGNNVKFILKATK